MSWSTYTERLALRQLMQLYCCRLILILRRIKAVPHRCSLKSGQDPRRNLYAPIKSGQLTIDSGQLILILQFHCSVDVAVGFLLGYTVTLIVQFFTLAKTDLNLDMRSRKIQRQGNQGETVPGNQAVQLHNFALVH